MGLIRSDAAIGHESTPVTVGPTVPPGLASFPNVNFRCQHVRITVQPDCPDLYDWCDI